MIVSQAQLAAILATTTLLLSVSHGCKREPTPVSTTLPAAAAGQAEPFIFPHDVRADDESVNEFLTNVMEASVRGDYDRFRLYWSVQYDPITRSQFDSAWVAASKIEIIALEHDERNGSYAAYAAVDFDREQLPEHHELYDNPRREVVLLIIKENGQWCLTRAPSSVRDYFIEKYRPAPQDAIDEPTEAPAQDDNMSEADSPERVQPPTPQTGGKVP